MKKKLKVPKFKTEDQERNFWSKINLADYFRPADFETVIDFTKIKKGSVPLEKLLLRLDTGKNNNLNHG